MPIYQYKCSACSHSLEAIQKMSDAPLLTCPACGEESLKKQLTAAAFHLKGTGWYATDFKNSGKPASPPAASSDTSASEGATTPVAPAAAGAATESSTSTKAQVAAE